MKDRTSKIVRTVYGAVFGAYTAVTAALLIWQTLDVYLSGKKSGGEIFSRSIVGERLSTLMPALVIWAALVVVGFALGLVFGVKARVGKQDIRYSLYRLRKRTPAVVPESMEKSVLAVRAEDTVLRVLWGIVAAVGTVGAVYTIVYLAIPSHFPSGQVTESVVRMVKHVIPWVTWTFLLSLGVGLYERFAAKRMIPTVKDINKASGSAAVRSSGADKFFAGAAVNAESGKFGAFLNKVLNFFRAYGKWVLRGAVGCLAVAFIIAGIFNGGAHDVIAKAINICTECIGLG